MQYIISVWLLHLLDRLLHYVIVPGEIEEVLVISNNIMTLGYTYSKLRFKIHPEIVYKLTHISRLISWTPKRLGWYP